jgi:acyl carrier protein
MITGGFFSGLGKRAAVFAPLDGPLTEDTLRDWLTRRIASQVELDPGQIDPAVAVHEYGLDSLVAVQITGDIEKVLNRPLSPALLFEYTTIHELARHLASPDSLEPAAQAL